MFAAGLTLNYLVLGPMTLGTNQRERTLLGGYNFLYRNVTATTTLYKYKLPPIVSYLYSCKCRENQKEIPLYRRDVGCCAALVVYAKLSMFFMKLCHNVPQRPFQFSSGANSACLIGNDCAFLLDFLIGKNSALRDTKHTTVWILSSELLKLALI